MNENNKENDWQTNSSCCICDVVGGDLRSSSEGIESLAQNFLEFWKNGVLPFDSSKITSENAVGSDGKEHPDFKSPMVRYKAKYHHNCHIRFSPYNLKRKVASHQKQKKKACKEKENLSSRASRSSTSRQASSDENLYSCIICGKPEELVNLHAAGTLHAKKDKLDLQHNEKLSENCNISGRRCVCKSIDDW